MVYIRDYVCFGMNFSLDTTIGTYQLTKLCLFKKPIRISILHSRVVIKASQLLFAHESIWQCCVEQLLYSTVIPLGSWLPRRNSSLIVSRYNTAFISTLIQNKRKHIQVTNISPFLHEDDTALHRSAISVVSHQMLPEFSHPYFAQFFMLFHMVHSDFPEKVAKKESILTGEYYPASP